MPLPPVDDIIIIMTIVVKLMSVTSVNASALQPYYPYSFNHDTDGGGILDSETVCVVNFISPPPPFFEVCCCLLYIRMTANSKPHIISTMTKSPVSTVCIWLAVCVYV